MLGTATLRWSKLPAGKFRYLSTNTRYLHDLINRYAERLCATMPLNR